MKALKAALNTATTKKSLNRGKKKVKANETAQKTMFVNGPAMAVLPTVALLDVPAIITAPGETILKGEKIESRVIKAPNSVSRNSAHNP